MVRMQLSNIGSVSQLGVSHHVGWDETGSDSFEYSFPKRMSSGSARCNKNDADSGLGNSSLNNMANLSYNSSEYLLYNEDDSPQTFS